MEKNLIKTKAPTKTRQSLCSMLPTLTPWSLVPKSWSCQVTARWSTAPQTPWALTLVTLLLTLLMLQMLLTLLGMVVIRMGAFRRSRVTSARGARGIWGLNQPTGSAPQLGIGSGWAACLTHPALAVSTELWHREGALGASKRWGD